MPEDFFSKPFFETWLSQPHPRIKDWFRKEVEYLKENIAPNSKVLDIGCGFGRHIEVISDRCEEIVGIDNNNDMIRKARERLPDSENIKLFVQDAQNLTLDDNYFDYVICMTNTFGDFPPIKLDVLGEMKRVCKEGGKIIISVYNDNSLEIRKKDYQNVGLTISSTEDGVVHTEEGLVSEQFTRKQLEGLFDKLGLESKISELTPIHLFAN